VTAEITVPSNVKYPLVIGWEDMRLFSHGGSLQVSATVREANEQGWCEQWIGRIAEEGHGYKVIGEHPMIPPIRENNKNWMPYVGDTKKPKFFYRVDKVVDDDGHNEVKREAPFYCADLSGGAQVIPFFFGHLALVHEAQLLPGNPHKRFYWHRFVLFDKDLNPLKASRPFFFHDKQIEFAAGMCWKDDTTLAISYGVRDKEAWACTVDAQEVMMMLGARRL
jgi:hypothetical protein